MSAAFRTIRIKVGAGNDLDPRDPANVPPESEVLVGQGPGVIGVRFGLVFTGAGIPAFTATVSIFIRDAATGTWFLAGTQDQVPHRRTVIQADIGTHDLWVGLSNITGGNPITISGQMAVNGC